MTRSSTVLPVLCLLTVLPTLGACKKKPAAEDTATPMPPSGQVDAGPGPAVDAGSATPASDAAPPAPSPDAALAAPTGPGAFSGFEKHYRYEAPACEVRGPEPSLPVSLDGLTIPGSASNWLSVGDAREKLAANGFVVTGEGFGKVDDIPDAYDWLRDRLPIFVTVDTALHLYHLAFDALLMTIEEQRLIPLLDELIGLLRDKALGAAGGTGPVADAAQGVLAVCDTLRVLLDESATPDASVASLVAAELALIDGHDGMKESPIFGYGEDYTQYIPRGHYTRTPALTRYFKAMMWIGRMSYLLKAKGDPKPEGLVPLETARRHAAMAAMITRWLGEAQADGRTALQRWEVIYRVTAFFAGFSDDLTPIETRPVVDELLGAAQGFDALADPAQVDLLRARLGALRNPRIYSGAAAEAAAVDPARSVDPTALLELVGSTVGMRLMGQRYTPDADVMGQLAFPDVGAPTTPIGGAGPFTLVQTRLGPVRGFSRGLDVMQLLGAPRARPILDELGDSAYERYDQAVQAAGRIFPPPDDPAWRQNLYWAWLDVLHAFVTPRERPTQAFETGDAWADRTLTTALASWAQLRHDTILYVKQPYAGFGAGAPPPPPPPKGFVEPNPEVFAKLIALNGMMRAGLEELQVLPPGAGEVLGTFDNLLVKLRDLAIKELEDRAIDETDNEFLSTFGGACGFLLDRIAALNVPASGDPAAPQGERGESAVDTKTTLVADVMTNVDAAQVLEEATGRLDLITVVMRAPGTGDLTIAVGPVLSYYEFRWPMADRLTDEKWRALLDSAEAPVLPPWTCSYRVPCPGSAPAPGSP